MKLTRDFDPQFEWIDRGWNRSGNGSIHVPFRHFLNYYYLNVFKLIRRANLAIEVVVHCDGAKTKDRLFGIDPETVKPPIEIFTFDAPDD